MDNDVNKQGRTRSCRPHVSANGPCGEACGGTISAEQDYCDWCLDQCVNAPASTSSPKIED